MGMKGYGNCQLGQQSLIATPKELLQGNEVSWSKCLLVQISKTLICCAQLNSWVRRILFDRSRQEQTSART